MISMFFNWYAAYKSYTIDKNYEEAKIKMLEAIFDGVMIIALASVIKLFI